MMVQGRAGAGGTVQLALRLPEDLRDRVRKAAEDGGRSLNSEIIATLEEHYPPPVAAYDLLAQLAIELGMNPKSLSFEEVGRLQDELRKRTAELDAILGEIERRSR